MIRRPPRSTQSRASAASDVYKRQRLQGWADAQDTFHLYDNLPVVEFADDFALQELLRAGGIRRYLLHIFSPRLVAIHPRHVNDLVAEMERRGLMPKVES